jgi:organic hydroperoxide reductase OsmC/OhrA
MSKEHQYQVSTKWTGNLGTGTSQYKAYSRSHEISGPKKQAPIVGSSDPLFRGDTTRYNPEELLVGALSACHMLWVLHLCADAGIVITDYSDEALGFMTENADGSAQFTGVTLRPVMTITDLARAADARAIHDRAHTVCALARSVNFPVHHEPVVAGASRSSEVPQAGG